VCVCVCACITIGLAIPLGKFLLKINGATNRVPVNYLPRRNLYGNSEINSTCSLYCPRVTGELKGGGISVEVAGGVDVTKLCIHIAFFEELTSSLFLPCPLYFFLLLFFIFLLYCSVEFPLIPSFVFFPSLVLFLSSFCFFSLLPECHTQTLYLHTTLGTVLSVPQ